MPGPFNGDPRRMTEQESSQDGADEAKAHQDGTEAHQGGADEVLQGGTSVGLFSYFSGT